MPNDVTEFVDQTACNDGPLEGFEGPEKRLEVNFKINSDQPRGMRAIDGDKWQILLNTVHCQIISTTSNDYMDSYVLSESSLFVYPFKIVLKTCGTTTLLRCLKELETYAADCGTSVELVLYSRKNFNFPHRQKSPHTCFELEVDVLSKYAKGTSHVIGPKDKGCDHHYIYVTLPKEGEDQATQTQLLSQIPYMNRPSVEILMSELDETAMQNFFRNELYVDAKTTTKTIGLADILPAMVTDEVMFDPCGYSINSISSKEDSYFTVHVTPEAHCSFVSFESNDTLVMDKQFNLLQKVVNIFRPGRFSLVMSAASRVIDIDFEVPEVQGYKRIFDKTYDLDSKFSTLVCNYVLPQNNRLTA